MLQVIHHTAPNVIKKMGKKIPEALYFTGFPAIEATGFEPTTSASRTQRSTKLSHASKYINGNDSFSLSANVIIQNLERVVNRKITRHIRRLPSRP